MQRRLIHEDDISLFFSTVYTLFYYMCFKCLPLVPASRIHSDVQNSIFKIVFYFENTK